MNAYDEREEQLGEELMRYLERSILLQVIDNRWREHLFDMDYLREGIHLRGFAQIDPLVAYKNEGFSMFEELMHSIWDEFSKLVFRAEIEVQPGAGAAPRPATAAASRPRSTTRAAPPEAQPSALRAGRRRRRRRRRGRRRRRAGGRSRQRRRGGRDRGQRRARQTSAATTPAGAAVGQKVQEVPRRLRARNRRIWPSILIPSASSSGPSTSGT